MAPGLSVLVVHNRPLLYEGVRASLTGKADFSDCRQARSREEAVQEVEGEAPSVLLCDLGGFDGRLDEFMETLAAVAPILPTVVLACRSSRRNIRRAIEAGARGYVCENSSVDCLAEALRTVARGEYFFGPWATRELVGIVTAVPEEYLQESDPGYELLSPREREVFRMLAEGMSNKEIAFRLGISRKTVEAHHTHLCRKLGVSDPLQLLRYAGRLGFIEVED